MDPRLPAPKMRDDFRAELRARLMREAVTALAPRPSGTAWLILRPAVGVGLAAVLLLAGTGTAAAGSLPGDATFPLKKAFENIQVTLTPVTESSIRRNCEMPNNSEQPACNTNKPSATRRARPAAPGTVLTRGRSARRR